MLRVLIVEDDADTAESTHLLLGLWGHTSRCARDGPTALQALDQFDADVVLLDLAMPGMDGYAVARQIRRRPGRRPIIVCLSGHGGPDHVRLAKEAGCDHFLVKPADMEQFRELLQQIDNAPYSQAP